MLVLWPYSPPGDPVWVSTLSAGVPDGGSGDAADPPGVPAYAMIPLSPRHIYTPADEVTAVLAMPFSKYRGDEDVFEIDCKNILATGEQITTVGVRIDRMQLASFIDVTSDFLFDAAPARTDAMRMVLTDAKTETAQSAGQYRVRVLLYTSLGRRLVTQAGLTVVA